MQENDEELFVDIIKIKESADSFTINPEFSAVKTTNLLRLRIMVCDTVS